MKQIYFLLFLSISVIGFSQTTAIPDPAFEQALIDQEIDTDGMINGQVLTADISTILFLDVDGLGISDLTGIEDFAAVSFLIVNNNEFTSLDVTQNTALEYLFARNNELTSLDVSQNIALVQLAAGGNQITSLDVTQNTALTRIDMFDGGLTSLDLTQNTALTRLDVGGNQLTDLDLFQNIALEELGASNNQLTSLDVSQSPELEELFVDSNQLTSLNIENGNNAGLDMFDATNNPDLFCVQVDDVVFAEANFSDSVTPGVDFSTNCAGIVLIPDSNFEQALIDLGIDSDGMVNGQVSIADISAVTSLDVSNSNITDLTGIEDFTALTDLVAFNNQLTSLDVTQNTTLVALDVSGNQLTSLNIQNGGNANFTNFEASNNSDLSCIQVDDVAFAEANFTNIDSGVVFSTNCDAVSGLVTLIPDSNFEQALIDQEIDTDGMINGQVFTADISGTILLNVDASDITDLTGIEGFASLESLFVNSNNLTSLDLTQNPALIRLLANTNDLTSLDISQNPALTLLLLNGSELMDLDLTSNPALVVVDVSNNELTSLDVSQNTALEEIFVAGNQLTSLNMQNGNNENLSNFTATNNPDLSCIQVDDVAFAEANFDNVPSGASFSINCDIVIIVDVTLIPDSNFEQALIDLGIDSDGVINGEVPTADISAITSLDVSNSSITDLTGIEDFTALTSLNVSSNELTSLDVTQNTELTSLDVSGNQLTSLNVQNGNNENFTDFEASNNADLSCIQVDDVAFAEANFTNVDSGANFSTDCDAFLSINDFELEGVMLFPNPTSSVLNVDLPSNVVLERVTIYNGIGQSLGSTELTSINVSGLSNGIYFLEITTDSGRATSRFIKE